ncbi:MAG: hypothetical protein OTJ45_06435, partial [Alphaproteobacteria bacterium]|nr:hypothetical protein [Alphaproteobacteria bacterium]
RSPSNTLPIIILVMGWPSNHPQGPYFVRKLIFQDTLDRLDVMPKRVVAHALRNEMQALVAVSLKPHAFKILSQL